MKESKYNYSLSFDEKQLFFNGRTKKFFLVSQKNKDVYESILKFPDKYNGKYSSFIEKIKKDGFILEDDTDEYVLMRQAYEEQTNPEEYTIMIVPTFKCNLSCWYCYQRHDREEMSEETIRRLKLHIKNYLTEHKIRKFHITWFGGEPFTMFDLIIDMCNYAKELCEELNAEFTTSFTTNSLLLTKERLEQLKEFEIKFFQITIDGTKEEHNKVKCHANVDTFTKALNNIIDIVTIIPKTSCTLRINCSSKNSSSVKIIEQVNEVIPESVRDRIKIDVQQVWQEVGNGGIESAADKMYSFSHESKFKTMHVHHGVCYVDYKHFNSFYPNGTVDICDHEGQETIGRATLNENGDIVWNEHLACDKYSVANDNILCSKCKHVLMCGGPCPVKRNEMMKNYGEIYCQFEKPNIEVNKIIKDYCTQAIYNR